MSDVYVTDQSSNVYTVKSGDLLLPLVGNWSAQLDFGGIDSLPSGQVTLTWYDTNYEGYVVHAGMQNTIGTCAIVGGAGGLFGAGLTKMYDYNVTAQLPLSEILTTANEILDINSTQSSLQTQLPSWIRRQTTVGQQVADLAEEVGCGWHVSQSGSVYFGDRVWALPTTIELNTYVLKSTDPTLMQAEFNTLSSAITPGMSMPVYDQIYKIGCIHYRLTDSGGRAQMWFMDLQNKLQLDPLREGLTQFVRGVMDHVDYHALYPAKVVVQRGDGTLDVIPDNAKWPPLTSVPIRTPWPGAKINVMPGDRVLIAFEEGDPVKFSAQLYATSQGGLPLARKGDMVDCGMLVCTAVGVAGTFTYVSPTGNSSTLCVITLPIPAAGVAGMITPGSVPVIGLINQGSPTIEDHS